MKESLNKREKTWHKTAQSSVDAVRCPTETKMLRRFNQKELRGASAGLY